MESRQKSFNMRAASGAVSGSGWVFSLGADKRQGSGHVGAIAANNIVASTYGCAAGYHNDPLQVPCDCRMREPQDSAVEYVKAAGSVVIDRAIDGQNVCVSSDENAVAILLH